MTDRVVVVGAGIVGVSTAIWCQRAGLDVTLVDRDGPAAGTSYGNAGILASYSIIPVTVPGLIRKAPRMALDANSPLFLRWTYLPVLMPWLFRYLKHGNERDVLRIAKALAPILSDSVVQHTELSAGTEAAQFLSPCDYWYVYTDEAAYQADQFAWNIRKQFNFEWEVLDQQALTSASPIFAGGNAGLAVNAAEHGRINDPGAYVKALADHFVAEGGSIEKASVNGLAIESGRVTALETDQGEIAARQVVLATGAWSVKLTEQLGTHIPMEAEGGYHVEFVNPSAMPANPAMISAGKFVATPMVGRLRCAGMVEFAGLDALKSRKPLDLLKRQVQSVFPDLGCDSVNEWIGYRPAPTDSTPVIGEFPQVKGVYGGFGHQHVGLTGGAKTGRLLASLLTAEDPGIDMSPYSPARFHR